MNNTRFVLYARKSSEREDRQIQSIDDQMNYWKKRAKEEGIEIVKIYTEEKSAKTPGRRTEFYTMCDDLEKWNIDGVLCWKLDRLSRNPVDTGRIQYMLQRTKIKRIITSDRVYYPEDSWLIFSVETGMANQYILDLSKNSKRWLQSKLDKWHFPGMAVQWYLNDRINRTIIPDPERFSMVKKMWEMLLSWCYSPQKILETATHEWWYRSLKRKKTWGKPLALCTLYDIFRNPFYAGYMRYNGQLKKWDHHPMITWEEFQKAQKLFGHTKWETGSIKTERPSMLEFSYTWVVACGECGCMVTAEKKTKILQTTKQEKSYTYYHCTHKKNSPTFRCSQTWGIPEWVMESQIKEILESIEIHPEYFDWVKEVLWRRHSEETQGRELVFESVNKAIENEEKKKNRLVNMRLNGEFDDNYAEYERLKKEMEEESQKLQIRRTELERESTNWTELVEDTFDFAKMASEKFQNGDLETKKLIFRSLGSNWTLKDGKLQANLHDWFLPFKNMIDLDSPDFRRLELNKKRTSLRKTDAFDDWIWLWWRGAELNCRHTAFQAAALPLSYPAGRQTLYRK